MQRVHYTHQNPVRLGLVETAEDYRFSSARIGIDGRWKMSRCWLTLTFRCGNVRRSAAAAHLPAAVYSKCERLKIDNPQPFPPTQGARGSDACSALAA